MSAQFLSGRTTSAPALAAAQAEVIEALDEAYSILQDKGQQAIARKLFDAGTELNSVFVGAARVARILDEERRRCDLVKHRLSQLIRAAKTSALTKKDLLVLATLAERGHPGTSEEIATEAGYSTSSTRSSLQRLFSNGLIARSGGGVGSRGFYDYDMATQP